MPRKAVESVPRVLSWILMVLPSFWNTWNPQFLESIISNTQNQRFFYSGFYFYFLAPPPPKPPNPEVFQWIKYPPHTGVHNSLTQNSLMNYPHSLGIFPGRCCAAPTHGSEVRSKRQTKGAFTLGVGTLRLSPLPPC